VKVSVFSSVPNRMVRPYLLMGDRSQNEPEHPRGGSWSFIKEVDIKEAFPGVSVSKAEADIKCSNWHIGG